MIINYYKIYTHLKVHISALGDNEADEIDFGGRFNAF